MDECVGLDVFEYNRSLWNMCLDPEVRSIAFPLDLAVQHVGAEAGEHKADRLWLRLRNLSNRGEHTDGRAVRGGPEWKAKVSRICGVGWVMPPSKSERVQSMANWGLRLVGMPRRTVGVLVEVVGWMACHGSNVGCVDRGEGKNKSRFI